jgi:hypothetical protein
LTTCYQDAGQHSERASSIHQVALQLSKKDFQFKQLNQSFCVYDAWHTLAPDRLNWLVPSLTDYDYVIDFYGLKPLDRLPESLVLGCHSSRSPIMQFGLEMRPIEMNVIAGVPGEGVALSPKTDVDRTFGLTHHALRVYPELGVGRLCRMVKISLIEKIRHRLGSRTTK